MVAPTGPREDTVIDFWRMIWEQNCSTVIMLTKCLENGRVCTASRHLTPDPSHTASKPPVNIFTSSSPDSAYQNTTGPNFRALLTVNTESALVEAGNSVLTSSLFHWFAGIHWLVGNFVSLRLHSSCRHSTLTRLA